MPKSDEAFFEYGKFRESIGGTNSIKIDSHFKYHNKLVLVSQQTIIQMLHTVLSGNDFNQKYKENKLVKLTNDWENHNGYQFQTGLNIDSIPFNPEGQCQAGGIYFCSLGKIPMWLNYADRPMIYVRWVTIPDDGLIWVEEDKFKADRLILSERRKIVDLEEWEDPVFCLEAVKQDGYALKYVKQQTDKVCLESVKQNGLALQFVKEQTEELCLEAVRQNGHALQFVKAQTAELCLEAVRRNGCFLKYVNKQTPKLCLEAVKQHGGAFQYVLEQSGELCLEAVRQDGWALKYVKEQTAELCLEAVKQDGLALQYVEEQTPEICLAAVKQTGYAWRYVLEQSQELCLEAVRQDGRALQYVPEQTP